jgi:uncharacterized iron-regulated membrane protein
MRPTLVSLHRWVGLTIGLLWSIQGLTGGLFVFSREVDRLVGPRPTAGAMVSLDKLIAAGDAVTGGRPVTRMAVTDAHRDVVALYYVDGAETKRATLIDGATARPLGARELEPATPFTGSASRWLYMVHETLNAGERGKALVGFSGLFLLSAAVTGLVLGWPRPGKARAAFDYRRWRGPIQKLFGWHRALGLLTATVFCVVASTGVFLAFPGPLREAFSRISSFQTSFNPMHAKAAPGAAVMPDMGPEHAGMDMAPVFITPQRALDIAMTRFPHAVWVRVFMPTKGIPVYSVRLRQPGELRAWIGTTLVSMNAYSGQVVDVYDGRRAPFINRLLDALFSIHNGEIAGLLGRVAVMLLGLSLPVLYVTGVLSWWKKQRLKAARRATSVSA